MILSVVRMLVLPVLTSVVLLCSLPAVEPRLRRNTESLVEGLHLSAPL